MSSRCRIGALGQVISLGDVFLAVGLGRFLEHELRRPRRYFKRGAHARGRPARPSPIRPDRAENPRLSATDADTTSGS